MVKMTNGSITIEVYEGDVSFYKAAGYSVVTETPKDEPKADEPKPAAKKKISKEE